MKIPGSHFFQFIPDPAIERSQALALVQSRFCAVLSRQNRCPGECPACQQLLATIFDLGECHHPLGVLRWRLDQYARGELSIWANTTPKLKVGRLDWLGLPDRTNPFEALADAFANPD